MRCRRPLDSAGRGDLDSLNGGLHGLCLKALLLQSSTTPCTLLGALHAVGRAALLAAALVAVVVLRSGAARVERLCGGGGDQVVGGFDGFGAVRGEDLALGGGGARPVALGGGAHGLGQAFGPAGACGAQGADLGGGLGGLVVREPIEVSAAGAGCDGEIVGSAGRHGALLVLFG